MRTCSLAAALSKAARSLEGCAVRAKRAAGPPTITTALGLLTERLAAVCILRRAHLLARQLDRQAGAFRQAAEAAGETGGGRGGVVSHAPQPLALAPPAVADGATACKQLQDMLDAMGTLQVCVWWLGGGCSSWLAACCCCEVIGENGS